MIPARRALANNSDCPSQDSIHEILGRTVGMTKGMITDRKRYCSKDVTARQKEFM